MRERFPLVARGMLWLGKRGGTVDVLLYAANFALLMAINVTIAWACSRILPLRNPRTIYVVQILSCILGIWVTWIDITPVNPLCFTFFYGVVPYLCWDAPRAQRVVCAVMLLLFLLVCESLTNSLITLAGNPYLNRRWSAPETMIVCRLAYVALIVAGTELLRKVAGQVLRGGSAGPVGWYGAFFAFQFLASIANFHMQLYSESTDFYVHTEFLVLAACLVADVVALYSMTGYAEAERERERTRLLEERLDQYLTETSETLDATSEAARFRHDQRNHLQVVRSLVARGEKDQALAYVRDLRSLVSEGRDVAPRPTGPDGEEP